MSKRDVSRETRASAPKGPERGPRASRGSIHTHTLTTLMRRLGYVGLKAFDAWAESAEPAELEWANDNVKWIADTLAHCPAATAADIDELLCQEENVDHDEEDDESQEESEDE